MGSECVTYVILEEMMRRNKQYKCVIYLTLEPLMSNETRVRSMSTVSHSLIFHGTEQVQ